MLKSTTGEALCVGSVLPCGAGASTATVSFANQIMPIFQSNCSVGGGTGPATLCHGDPSAAMPFAPGGTRQWFGPPSPAVNSAATLTMIYSGFVNQPSTEDLSMDVITPGDPTQSFLWYKIDGTQGSLDRENLCGHGELGVCGSAMPLPLTGATITLLPQADLDLVCTWIVQGASGGGIVSEPLPIRCAVDTDCPGTTCGSQVCNAGTCTPAGAGLLGQDGSCGGSGTPNCKCANLGATCGELQSCTFTTPPTASLPCTTTEAPYGACSCEQAIEGRDYVLTCTTTNGTVSCTCFVDGAVTFAWNPHPPGYSDPTFCASASSISTFFTAPGTAPVTGCNFP